jgi:transposase-like protein
MDYIDKLEKELFKGNKKCPKCNSQVTHRTYHNALTGWDDYRCHSCRTDFKVKDPGRKR